MKKKFVIVGLRAMRPWDLLSGSVTPGYLGIATENHRYGFLIGTKWHAWYSDIFSGNHMLETKGEFPVLQFDNEQDAINYTALLLQHDNGTFRPVTILEVYL